MNKGEIKSLDTLLTLEGGSTSFQKTNIPSDLVDTKYIQEEIRLPTRCRIVEDCQASCDCKRKNGEILIECDDSHKGTISVNDQLYYDIDFKLIIKSVAEILGKNLENFDDGTRPRYVSGTTEDGIDIYLVISPSDYEKAINEICITALSEDTPTLLITPQENVKNILEIKSLFSSSNLIYTVPFTMLTEPTLIRNSLSTIKDIQHIERRILQDLDSEHPVIKNVNSNPRYILTELNHMRLLRLAKEIPQHSGTRLEKIAETALSHLFVTYPEAGGEDDRGGNVPDNLFYISDSVLPKGSKPILGVADSKSGDDAGFGSEKIEGKHDIYLKKARRHSLRVDQIAHMFLVLGFDGQKEIEFYDGMSEVYKEGEYLVIMTAEALALILTAYLSHSVSNELKLINGNFQAVIHPFFDKESFKESGLGSITREVGRNQNEYDQKYQQRDGLMIITQKVVKERIKKCIKSPNDVEELFKSYFKPLPTI